MVTSLKSFLWALVVITLAGLVVLPATAGNPGKSGGQTTFSSPQKAVGALVAAVRGADEARLTSIFGPGSDELIRSGDPVADRNGRERFLKAYAERFALKKTNNNLAVLHLGTLDYPFPIPIVRQGKRWLYDTQAGKEEILNRRIGRNELRTMEVLQAYVAAQHEFACIHHRDNEGTQFARQLISSSGKHNGLYWPSGEGEKESPLGPLMAQATQSGYAESTLAGTAEPFRGYYFKILTAQGPHATGGQFDYLVNGKMVLGFGMVAYPARYGSTGVKTFIVNQEGSIYEKDLGQGTPEAAAMESYDPDETWQKCRVPEQGD